MLDVPLKTQYSFFQPFLSPSHPVSPSTSLNISMRNTPSSVQSHDPEPPHRHHNPLMVTFGPLAPVLIHVPERDSRLPLRTGTPS